MAKWKRRISVVDLPTGPGEPKSTVLSSDEEAVIVAFRRHMLLRLDDCLYSFQATIPLDLLRKSGEFPMTNEELHDAKEAIYERVRS